MTRFMQHKKINKSLNIEIIQENLGLSGMFAQKAFGPFVVSPVLKTLYTCSTKGENLTWEPWSFAGNYYCKPPRGQQLLAESEWTVLSYTYLEVVVVHWHNNNQQRAVWWERMVWQPDLNHFSRLRPSMLPNDDCIEAFFENKGYGLQIIFCWTLFSYARWCLKFNQKKKKRHVHKNKLRKKKCSQFY